MVVLFGCFCFLVWFFGGFVGFYNYEIKQVRNIHMKSLLKKRKQVCTLSCSYSGNEMKSHPLSQIPRKCCNTNSKSSTFLSLNTFTAEAGLCQIWTWSSNAISRFVQTPESEHCGRKAAQNLGFQECKLNWSWASTEEAHKLEPSEKLQAVRDFSAYYGVSNILLISFIFLYYAKNICISEAWDQEEKQVKMNTHPSSWSKCKKAKVFIRSDSCW